MAQSKAIAVTKQPSRREGHRIQVKVNTTPEREKQRKVKPFSRGDKAFRKRFVPVRQRENEGVGPDR